MWLRPFAPLRLGPSRSLRRPLSMSAAEVMKKLLETRGQALEARAELLKKLEPRLSCVASKNLQNAAGGGTVREFALQHTDEAGQDTRIAVSHVAVWPQGTALIFGVACDPALPLCSAGAALVTAVLEKLRKEGCEEFTAIARLEGLCQWMVREEIWAKRDATLCAGFDDEMAEAVEAIAKGIPRRGHSVLGQGTFAAGRPAFEALALEFATSQTHPDHELTALRDFVEGSQLTGINWMHDTSPEAMKSSGGCTVSFDISPPVLE